MFRLSLLTSATLLSLTISSSTGQNITFYNPIALPPGISGSFGEIRPNHFHSGVDIRTNGKTGYRVYASDDGFISRIKVSATGFGKTVYIDHPNGLTTVYAHLNNFSEKISKYVLDEQYAQKSFEVELFPGKNELTVKKGETIGFSGNSGSSGGPHLHYEVRHTATQVTIAPLQFLPSWRNVDTSAPSVKTVFLYSMDSINYLKDSLPRQGLKFFNTGKGYHVPDTIYATGKVGLGIESNDFVNAQSNRCGFKETTLSIDGRVTFSLAVDSFSFAETKYANSVIDYPASTVSSEETVKLWADDNNKFSGLKFNGSRGYINVEEGKIYHAIIKIKDFFENTSAVDLVIKGKNSSNTVLPELPTGSGTLFKYGQENVVSTDEFEIIIPKDALYHNILFCYSTEKSTDPNKTIYRIHTSRTPLHKKFTLRVKQVSANLKYPEKGYLGYLDGKGIEYCESRVTNEYIEATCGKFGSYMVLMDTIPPQISPVKVRYNSDISDENQLKFRLTDNTGINSYNGYIDDRWILLEWDPKTKMLAYTFDRQRVAPKAWHRLKVEVTDKLDNKSEFIGKFFW